MQIGDLDVWIKTVQQPDQRYPEPPDKLETGSGQVDLSFMLYNRLTYSEPQLKMLANMASASQGRLVVGTPIETRRDFENELSQSKADMLYFFCHGFTRLDTPGWLDILKEHLAVSGSAVGKELAAVLSSNEFGQRRVVATLTLTPLHRGCVPYPGRCIRPRRMQVIDFGPR
jgi:hypothetical protein